MDYQKDLFIKEQYGEFTIMNNFTHYAIIAKKFGYYLLYKSTEYSTFNSDVDLKLLCTTSKDKFNITIDLLGLKETNRVKYSTTDYDIIYYN